MSSYLPSLQTFVKATAGTVATLTCLATILVLAGQYYLIYPSYLPAESRTVVDVPSKYGLPYEDLELKTSDGVLIKAYLMLQNHTDHRHGLSEEEYIASRPTVIMFHGNAGNFGHRIPLARMFFNHMHCNVLMVCYRGYGLSKGSPSERGLQKDAQAGLDYLLAHPVLKRSPIVLYGQSIGGAVAIDLASKNQQTPDAPIRALILENTFTSLPALVPHVMPPLGRFAFLCHQKWDSASKVPSIPAETPVLMLSGVKDEIVPREHMRRLWTVVKARKRRDGTTEKVVSRSGEKGDGDEVHGNSKFVEFPSGTHNDTCVQAGYWNVIADFMSNLS
ncbi:hypothetical protein D9619_012315 [Psilocybe cf. subviscida]|uniref:Serine aminopeptidase S33 domain-containing protein n=1 Tax=Psilocybe cf. subviscida TaxID=2480587 RepID=A0A8H5ARG6_9AGAR|nr:hypothetical protein D9619_012315 [Psilocybe cf. subviscida]